jgi:hypothetical protein
MIAIHEYPLSMVDHAGFRRFCATLQPLFKLVSRNTIKKDILNMYEVQRLSLVDYFQRCQSRIAVTTDMWTTNHQKKGYMSITIHFIDDDWKLKSFLLRYFTFNGAHLYCCVCVDEKLKTDFIFCVGSYMCPCHIPVKL